ncbi:MAG: DUF447 domain-containing protein [Halopenitus sp.]
MTGSWGDGHDDAEANSDSGEWPVDLRGVTETVVATLGPNDLWNMAALGVHAPESGDKAEGATARTYGRTRTRRNFEVRGGGVVQFTSDPREFVDAALTVREEPEPVLPGVDAWVEVDATRVDADQQGDTEIVTWELSPVDSEILEERVPTINRGFGAVVDATVAASRLDVPDFDESELLSRLAYFAETVERCGGPREREAFARIDEVTNWRERR